MRSRRLGEVYAIMNMATDVTQRVLARQQLLGSEAALQNALELAELGTWSMAVATGETLLSPRHAEMFGLETTLMQYEQVLVEELPVVKGDESQLGQMFQNLLRNAIKFTPAGQGSHLLCLFACLIGQANKLHGWNTITVP